MNHQDQKRQSYNLETFANVITKRINAGASFLGSIRTDIQYEETSFQNLIKFRTSFII
jgi:hypothetical protein